MNGEPKVREVSALGNNSEGREEERREWLRIMSMWTRVERRSGKQGMINSFSRETWEQGSRRPRKNLAKTDRRIYRKDELKERWVDH